MRRTTTFVLVLFCLAFNGTGFAEVYKCRPEIKYECSKENCERNTEGFQHAENFDFDGKTAKMSACLWTNCYEGKALVFKDKSTSTFTAVGRLAPSAHPGNEPITVSMTVDSKGSFTAIWGYGSEGLTFDMGKCEIPK